MGPDRGCPARRWSGPGRGWRGQLSERRAGAKTSSLFSLLLRRNSVILEYLDSPVERIHDEDAVVAVDEQTGRQLKFAQPRAASAEVIKELSFAIEYLN